MKTDAGMQGNFTNLWNKALAPADLSSNVAFVMDDETTQRYRQD